MWWDAQNLNSPRRDRSGKQWNIRVWHDVVNTNGGPRHVARVFFWDDTREGTGVRLFGPDSRTHVSVLRAFIEKLVADPKTRSKYRRELNFPLENNYSQYGAFAEETSN